MGKKSLITLFFILSGLAALSQPTANKYLIVTFEVDLTPYPHGIEYYNFITPVEDLKKRRFQLTPLYLGLVTSRMLNRCKNEDSIDVVHIPADVGIPADFGKSYDTMVDNLWSIVKKGKVKVQTISSKWLKSSKWTPLKRKVNVYLTPIEGEFCNCRGFNNTPDKTILYSAGKVFLPVSFKGYYGEFWKTKDADVAQMDYSLIDYGQARFPGMYGPYVEMEK